LAKKVVPDRLLIVGGTGFIGTNLTQYAVDCGYLVTVLSLNIPPSDKKNEQVTYLQADVANLLQLKKKLISSTYEYVVNLSGYVVHHSFLEGGISVLNNHFTGVQNILQVIDWSALKRFVQIGSSDEYGGALAPQHESLRESPISSYAVGKAASAQLLQMLAKTENFPVVILRLFLVYGPGQDSGRFLPQIIKGCFSGKEFETSSGEQLRDFCYIDDITDGILRALKSDNVNGDVINLASGDPISIRTVIEKVKIYIGKGNPKFGKIAYRAGENMSLYADTSRAEFLLGWRSKTTIEGGIKKTVDHYRVYDLK
jgi:nucleoside-diphosphate-sugar epimerase